MYYELATSFIFTVSSFPLVVLVKRIEVFMWKNESLHTVEINKSASEKQHSH